MATVFISCSRTDLEGARELQSALAPRHTAYWIDREGHGSEED